MEIAVTADSMTDREYQAGYKSAAGAVQARLSAGRTGWLLSGSLNSQDPSVEKMEWQYYPCGLEARLSRLPL